MGGVFPIPPLRRMLAAILLVAHSPPNGVPIGHLPCLPLDVFDRVSTVVQLVLYGVLRQDGIGVRASQTFKLSDIKQFFTLCQQIRSLPNPTHADILMLDLARLKVKSRLPISYQLRTISIPPIPLPVTPSITTSLDLVLTYYSLNGLTVLTYYSLNGLTVQYTPTS